MRDRCGVHVREAGTLRLFLVGRGAAPVMRVRLTANVYGLGGHGHNLGVVVMGRDRRIWDFRRRG
jgi:hypothetical protein